MHLVYFLKSIPNPERTYTGYSGQETAEVRLANHNTGSSPVTRPYKPWQLCTYLVFPEENKARRFEAYCHTGSGKAWASKHIFELFQ